MICRHCEKPLTGRRRVWCNERCRHQYQETLRTEFSCTACGRVVLIRINKVRRQQFCSLSCAYKNRRVVSLSGPRNPRWRGGRVLSYGPNWKAIKQQARARDRVCRVCGKTPEENRRALDVHHIGPYRFTGDHSLSNLVALCRSCHMRAVDIGRRGPARFAALSSFSYGHRPAGSFRDGEAIAAGQSGGLCRRGHSP